MMGPRGRPVPLLDPEHRPAQRIASLRVLASASAALILLGAAGGVLLHGLARKEDVAAATTAAVLAHEQRTDPEGVERRLRSLEIGQAEIKSVVQDGRDISAWNQATLFELAQRQGLRVPPPKSKHTSLSRSVSSATAAARP